jgi:Ca2+/Na+ antiporter
MTSASATKGPWIEVKASSRHVGPKVVGVVIAAVAIGAGLAALVHFRRIRHEEEINKQKLEIELETKNSVNLEMQSASAIVSKEEE